MSANETPEAEVKEPQPTLFPGKRHSLLGEFWLFIKNEKKWWLTPIIVVFILLAFLIFVGNSPLAPFIYPLF